MLGRKKPATGSSSSNEPEKDKEKYLHDTALNWESSRVLMIEKSERRAWTIAMFAVGSAIALAISIALMLPLKENTPYVIRVDDATGIPDIITAMDTKGVQFDEVMDKYWLAQYVRAHETYDWYTLQKDYDTVGLLSSARVGQEYAALFDGKDALDKRYSNSVRVTVEIVSVVPNGKGIGTVRFTKNTKRADDPKSPGTITKWVATVAYEYRNPSMIRESARLVNPFGFQVLSYRVDPEMGVSQ